MKKMHWQSKWTFILAAIGSAAGLGNLWRFPYQVYDHGGWSFIIAYLVLLILLGIGLLVGEVALGQKHQKGAVGTYSKMHKGFGWLGWIASLGALAILSYYMAVVGWSMRYLGSSVTSLSSGVLPWSGDVGGYFYGATLGLTDGVGDKGVLSKPVLWATIISFILLYLFTFKSVRSVGKVIWFTATLPFVTLAFLALYAIGLEGSGEGLKYLATLDPEKLTDSKTWIAAAGQIFFTLSVAMGVMITYGAFKSDKSEIVKSTIIVAVGNSVISFLSAIAVFAGVGYLAASKGVEVTEVVKGGPGLVFEIFPEIIATLGSIGPIIGVLFFATIFFLAIDSAMSLYECFARVIHDTGLKIKIEWLTLILILITFVLSTTFIFGNGLYMLDIVDHYITSYLMLIIGLLTSILLLSKSKDMTKYITKHSDWKWIRPEFWKIFWSIAIVVLAFLLYQNIADGVLVYDSYDAESLRNFGLTPLIGMLVVSVLLSLFVRVKK